MSVVLRVFSITDLLLKLFGSLLRDLNEQCLQKIIRQCFQIMYEFKLIVEQKERHWEIFGKRSLYMFLGTEFNMMSH